FRRISRGLRIRLTISYAVMFTLLFALVALFLREKLKSSLDDQVVTTLDADWGTLKGYMRIEPCIELDNKVATAWYYDQDDPDETTAVLEARKIYMVTDQNGAPIPNCVTQQPAFSTTYEDIGLEKKDLIRQQIREGLAAQPKEKRFYMDRKTSDGVPVKV